MSPPILISQKKRKKEKKEKKNKNEEKINSKYFNLLKNNLFEFIWIIASINKYSINFFNN